MQRGLLRAHRTLAGQWLHRQPGSGAGCTCPAPAPVQGRLKDLWRRLGGVCSALWIPCVRNWGPKTARRPLPQLLGQAAGPHGEIVNSGGRRSHASKKHRYPAVLHALQQECAPRSRESSCGHAVSGTANLPAQRTLMNLSNLPRRSPSPCRANSFHSTVPPHLAQGWSASKERHADLHGPRPGGSPGSPLCEAGRGVRLRGQQQPGGPAATHPEGLPPAGPQAATAAADGVQRGRGSPRRGERARRGPGTGLVRAPYPGWAARHAGGLPRHAVALCASAPRPG